MAAFAAAAAFKTSNMLINPSSSLSISRSLEPRPFPAATLGSQVAPLPLRGCASVNSAIARNAEQTPSSSLLLLVHLRLPKLLLVQCNCYITNLLTDTDVMTLFSLLQGVGISEKETDLMLDACPSLKSSPPEFIRNRILCLQSLKINGLSLSRLLRKRPEILTAEGIDSPLCFLRDDLQGMVEPAQVERLLSNTEPSFFLGFIPKIKLLLHHGISQEKLPLVLNKINLTKAICLKSVEEIERTLTYLNRFGAVNLILRRPAILNYDLENQLIPRIEFLFDLSGGDEDATATVLRKLPFILAYSVEHFRGHVDFLILFAGLSIQEIFRIVLIYPNLFSASRKRKLHPRIDFLKQCGLSSREIFKFLLRAPLFISLSFEENLAHKLCFLVKVGYENRTKDLAMAMGAVTRTSCKNMQEAISVFLNYGLTCEDILAMSKKHPQILQYNHESLEEKLDYLIEDMGRDVRDLLAFPAFLGYKLDGRIKHRYELKKKILGEGMSLNKLLSESTARFSRRKYPADAVDDLGGS